MKLRIAPLVVAAVLGAGLSGCEQPAVSPQDVTVATVGGQGISEAELERAVSRLGPLARTDAAEARSKVLEALIDQVAVSNAAKSAKLDRQPDVALALQQAQRQVLVDAYMERLFAAMARPTGAEIADYYARHPELFAARKVYRVQELELQLPASRLPEVEARLKRSRDLSDFAAWLQAQGVDSRAGLVIQPAEQIPPAFLAQLKNLGEGQVAVIATGPQQISVLQLQGTQAQPLSVEQARGTIERVLQGEKRGALLEAELGKLRGASAIEYANGYAPSKPAAPARGAAAPPVTP
jgi:EpsD family peptidyl-prolyl cis-trans isomerase